MWHFHPLGILLAAVFAVVMASLFWWMLRVPPQVSPAAAVARRSLDVFRTILVPVIERPYSLKAVELACRLAEGQEATIMIAAFLEIPLSLPLGAPFAQAEAATQEVLDSAKSVVGQHGLEAATRIQRARDAAEGILALAREENVDLIVVGVTPKALGAHSALGKTAESLLRRAPCEVVLDRALV